MGEEIQGDFQRIIGFGPARIYAAGTYYGDGSNASLIAHFDGQSWTKTILPGWNLQAIGGSGPSDIWAGGIENSLFHFDGGTWPKIDVDRRLWFLNFCATGGRTFAQAYKVDDEPHDSTWYYFLEWKGADWDTLNSALDIAGVPISSSYGIVGLDVVGNELYSSGPQVYRLRNDHWEKLFDKGGPGVFGTLRSNLFVLSYPPAIHQFNGVDWFEFTQFASYPFTLVAGWTDGREAFIVGNDHVRSVVLHGR